MSDRRAVLLAGGRGTRLKPYTIAIPKPLVPVGDKPILELIIEKLRSYGFNHITISVNHLAELIQAFFGDGAKWDVKIDYVTENKPLSTMGPLRLIDDLPDNFLVMNGDVISDLHYGEFLQNHINENRNFTVAVSNRIQKIDYGVLSIKDDELIGFQEKPQYSFSVSMGIYAVKKDVVNLIPENEFFGFDNLMLKMIAENIPVKTFTHSGQWLDIGRPDDYELAIQQFIQQD